MTDRIGHLTPGTAVLGPPTDAPHIPRERGVVLARSAPWPGFVWVLIGGRSYLRNSRQLSAQPTGRT